jgi:hypothetical protein
MDGELLVRGQDRDYIIDYNTAEITFTAKRLVNKDKRIVAEFQYADRNFARSLVAGGAIIQKGKFTYGLHLFSEQDNKNKPFAFTLDADQRELLREVGDSINRALIQKIDTVPFSDTQVLYLAKDTIVDGLVYERVFVYSINPELARYRPAFSFVGPGKGNYRQINSTANGRVYQWIAPVEGVLQGDHEPILLLPTPKQNQMLVSTVQYQTDERNFTRLELALSNNNINTFSDKDKADDKGVGIKLVHEGRRKLSASESGLSLLTLANYEMISTNFTQIERFRSVEFERDWNLTSVNPNATQHIISGGLGLEKDLARRATYRLTIFDEANFYRGLQHALNSIYQHQNWLIRTDASLLQSDGLLEKSSFFRQKATVSRLVAKRFNIGIFEEQERSAISSPDSDSLNMRSFHFFEWQAFVNSADTSRLSYDVRYIHRTDWFPKNGAFIRASLGQSVIATANYKFNNNSNLNSSVTYRDLRVYDSLLIGGSDDKTLLSRWEYTFRALKGAISSTTFYEAGSGQEVRKEYTFIEVAAGQGAYTWIDYNSNGIKELNEFEIAVFNDQARFIKVFTPTNQFVRTYNNQFSEILNLGAPSKWSRQKKSVKKFVSRFNNQTAYRIDRKSQDINPLEAFNPLRQTNFDSSLVSLNSSLRNTFFFNKLDAVAGVDYTIQRNQSRVLLVNGYETRKNDLQSFRFRWNVIKRFVLHGDYTEGVKSNNSDFFANRNYSIRYREMEPRVTFQPNVSFKSILSYRFGFKQNQTPEDSDTRSDNSNLSLELRYNVVSKGTLSSRISWVNLKFNGDVNSPIAFEMLEGLLPGDNYVWNISYQRTLANNMQLSLNYDGRKSPTSKMIHTGGVQVRAFF